MKFLSLLVPSIFLVSFIAAAIKKVNIYESFISGVKKAPPLVLSVFPYIAAVSMLSALFEISGLSAAFLAKASPVFSAVGVPPELCELVLIKPLSGSGSAAVLSKILSTHGVDGYVGRCACVVFGGNETIFYVGAVYFSQIKRKKITAALVVCLISYALSVIFSCFLCRIL